MSTGADEVWRRDEIESPCVKVCVLHPASKLCMGCYRSGREITLWSRMTPEERRTVMAELPERAATMEGTRFARRGGRAKRLRREDG